MDLKRGLIFAACSTPLLGGHPSAIVAAFSVAARATKLSTFCSARALQQPHQRRLLLSASTEPTVNSSERSVAEGASRARARIIAAEARQRARQARRQTLVWGTEQGTAPNADGFQRRAGAMPPILLPRTGTDTPRRDIASPMSQRPVAKPPRRRLAETRALEIERGTTVGTEAIDEKARRVREILDEYLLKAPPAAQWPPGRRMRVRGVDIHYKDTGKRGVKRGARTDQPTLVLLHGLAGSTASWDEVIGDLAEYGRVISFDRPGFGKTERVMPPGGLPWRLCPQTLGENPYSASFAAKALFGILDRLGVDKVILVAHSLGAQVALRAARTRPDMVRAMVLTAPAVLNPLDSKFVMGRDPSASLFSSITKLRTRVEMTAKLAAFNLQLLQPGEAPLETVRNITLNGDVEEKMQRNFHDPSISATRPELISKYVEPLTDPLWDRGLLHFYKSLQGEVQPGEQLLSSTLEVWKGPSMIITGDNDPTVPTQSSVYVAEEMEGRLVVMESCAHIPMDEKPEVFTSAVLSFANSEEVRDAWVADGSRAKKAQR